MVAGQAAQAGQAGDSLDDPVIDGIWALTGPEVFAKLVLDRGWSIEAYEQWLVDAVTPLLSRLSRPSRPRRTST